MEGRVDIGNVRGLQGEKGEKGDRGSTPSYEDLRYKKINDEFVTIVTTSQISQTNYYLDAERRLCNSEGYLYDENMNLTNTKGVAYDESIYGYKYEPLYKDEQDRFTNSKGELLDENFNVQYVVSEFISDITSFIYEDDGAYSTLVTDLFPKISDRIVSADPTDNFYKAFFDAIEGDVKYYICADNPATSIYMNGNTIVNNCKYKDENGVLVNNENGNGYASVPLEKNALYLYNGSNYDDNDVMHYDIYVCLKAGTVPKKLVSKNDFSINYNVIDDLDIDVKDENNDEENEVILNIKTRGTRGQFYSMSDVDQLFYNNVIDKLGEANGIAQLNNSGKVPSFQLPAYIDDVVEGTMNSAETTFTPSDETYVDSVRQKGKIYVDTATRKTYRWTGSAYIFISNPVIVDDGSTEAFASVYGSALQTKVGSSTLNTTNKNISDAINEHESDISSLNSNKQDKSDNNLSTTNKTVVGGINELNTNKLNKSDIATNLTTNDDTKVLSAKQGKLLQDNKIDKSSIVNGVVDNNSNVVSSNGVYDTLNEILDNLQKDSLVLYSNKDIIQSSDVVTLYARGFGNVLDGQSIDLYSYVDGTNDNLISSLPINSGIAKYNYTGSGSGEKKYYLKKGSVVSEIYEVLDCQFYDGGVTGNTNTDWFNYQNRATINSADSEGTLIEITGNNDGYVLCNIKDSSKGSLSDVIEFNMPFCVEFDVVSYTDTTVGLTGFWLADASNESTIALKDRITTGHIKIETDGVKVNAWANDVQFLNNYSFVNPMYNPVRCGFKVYHGTSLKYKDFKLYTI